MFLKDFFEKDNIEKKSADKSMKNYPACKELTVSAKPYRLIDSEDPDDRLQNAASCESALFVLLTHTKYREYNYCSDQSTLNGYLHMHINGLYQYVWENPSE